MTPTRLALLSPAIGSRQCKASTDLGRGPHVSSFLHMHLPISPLPSSFLSLSFRHSLPLSFLPSWLFICLILFFSSFSSLKSVPSTYLQQIYTGEVKQTALSLRRQPMAKLDSINTGVAEELEALLQSPLPSLTSLALCSQHTPQAHEEGNAGQSPPVLVMTLMLDIGRWEPWGSSVQGKHGIAHGLVFIKANCIFLRQTF